MEYSGDPPVLEIGLVMAGAVSAGAYTAGVLDYFVEALESWEEAKKNGDPVPGHFIRIRVITGASAGGMSAAVFARELVRRQEERHKEGAEPTKSLLRQAWVDMIDIDGLLKTNDFKHDHRIRSLLDSTPIDEIADRVIAPEGMKDEYIDLPVYVSERLKIYLTLTNLRGLAYNFNLEGETGLPFGMNDHADYQFFEFNGRELSPDKDSSTKGKTYRADWVRLRNAAVATGAFPVGLAPRIIERDTKEYGERLIKDGNRLTDFFQLDLGKDEAYSFVAVDGGALNNEPIELARSVWSSRDTTGTITETEAATVSDIDPTPDLVSGKNALIIIDPFPNFADKGKPPHYKKSATIAGILFPIISALRSQNTFKPGEMLLAASKKNLTRFLVAPIRYTNTGSKARNAIASGFMGGFGGFISKDFRLHDYRLGRRNGQQFLRKYFTFPEDSEAFKPFLDATAPEVWAPYTVTDPRGKKYYQLIPLMENKQPPEGQDNNWPFYTKTALKELRKKVRIRAVALIDHLPLIRFLRKKYLAGGMVFSFLVMLLFEIHKCCNPGSWTGSDNALFQVFHKVFIGLSLLNILLFQAIFFALFIVLLLLYTGRYYLDHFVTQKAIHTVRNIMEEWGIEIR